MQVYMAVQDIRSGQTLIVKKRIYNAWWDREIDPEGGSLVNNAGQWAFPGGADGGQPAEKAAHREFLEETGISLAAKVKLIKVHLLRDAKGTAFALVQVALVETESLAALCKAINANLMPAKGYKRPVGNVRDWELFEALVVATADLRAYLGTRIACRFVPDPSHWKQAIDWYAICADALIAGGGAGDTKSGSAAGAGDSKSKDAIADAQLTTPALVTSGGPTLTITNTGSAAAGGGAGVTMATTNS